ncbi:hypothetical protein [Medusavirus stheno T3]|uniref:Uncharacterized protein n=1 Tax=Medusavirus stheno T3 TaxID=3069717 RepID=A0A7S8BDI7_9VIRU|nr:hypothetical protein QKU73_gp058 [Acanthamoeba castellanii medusavirus]QPB44239.1 hypothetical protein [Medusavirus stheno T3]
MQYHRGEADEYDYDDEEDDILASSSDDDDENPTEEQSESIRWMKGTDQKLDGIAKRTAELEETERRIAQATNDNLQLHEMLKLIPEIAPPASPRRQRPSTRTNNDAPASLSTAGRSRVFAETLSQVSRRIDALRDDGRAPELLEAWCTLAAVLSEVPTDINSAEQPEVVARRLSARLLANLNK